MPIKFNCHKCGANLRVPEKHIGKKARCPKCDEKCIVPETSQRSDSGMALGRGFEDIGGMLDQPVAAPLGMPASAAIPEATPLPPSMPSAMAATVTPSAVASPYASPTAKSVRGNALSGSVMQPFYEARGMMTFWGWCVFIVGILYCLTIFGAIFGWLFIWIGWLVKGAAESITIGIETGDKSQLQLASQRLSTFFRIMGVLAIIWVSIVALYFLFLLVLLIIGLSGAIAAA